MKTIELSKNKFTIVDDEDFEYLNQWKWSYYTSKKYSGYAKRIDLSRGGRICVTMHRLITQAPKGFEVDHINHNTLDNRKENLRIVTHSQNLQNQNRKGIRFYKYTNKWQIRIQGKSYGYYKTEAEARDKYLIKRKEIFGEYAYVDSKLV